MKIDILKRLIVLLVLPVFLFGLSGCNWFNQGGNIPQNDSSGQSDSAQSQQNQDGKQHGAALSEDQISFDYEITEDDVEFLTQNDSYQTIMESTPYYMGVRQFGMPAFARFAELRKAKVEEAKKLTLELYSAVKVFDQKFKPYRKVYLDFIGTAFKEEPALKKFVSEVMPQFTEYLAQEQFIQTGFEAIKTAGLDEFSASSLEYNKTALALKLARFYYEDFAYLLANGVQLYSELKNSDNAAVHLAASDFDAQMQNIDQLNGDFNNLNKKVAELKTVLKQIDTGDYYMAMAGVSFMDEQLPLIKEKIKLLKASDYVRDQDIGFMQKYAEGFDSFSLNLEEKLEKIGRSGLLDVPDPKKNTGFIPSARAGFNDYLKSAKDILKESVKEVWDTSVDNAKAAWSATKDYAKQTLDNAKYVGSQEWQEVKDFADHPVDYTKDSIKQSWKEAKDVVNQEWQGTKDAAKEVWNITKQNTKLAWNTVKKGYEVVKSAAGQGWQMVKDDVSQSWQAIKDDFHTGQKIIGVGLDAMGAATKSVFDVGFNLYNGNSLYDIEDEIANNIVAVKENYDAGKSGTQILKTAEKYLEGVDHAAQDAGEALGGLVDDEGHWTSWGIGKVAQITSSIFTTFGKGIYRLANHDSTTGEYVQGALDVGLSFIGGSKVLVKGSQALGGTAEALDLINASGLNFVQRLWNKLEIMAIKTINKDLLLGGKLTVDQVRKYIGNTLAVDSHLALDKTLQTVGKLIDKQFEKLVADGGKTVFKNLTDGAIGSFEELVGKGFEFSLNGIRKAIQTALAGGEVTLENYFNNVVGTGLDDWFKEKVKELIDGEGNGDGNEGKEDGDGSDESGEVDDFADSDESDESDGANGPGGGVMKVDCKTFSYEACIDASRTLPGSVYDKESPFFKAWANCSRQGSICEFGIDSATGESVDKTENNDTNAGAADGNEEVKCGDGSGVISLSELVDCAESKPVPAKKPAAPVVKPVPKPVVAPKPVQKPVPAPAPPKKACSSFDPLCSLGKR